MWVSLLMFWYFSRWGAPESCFFGQNSPLGFSAVQDFWEISAKLQGKQSVANDNSSYYLLTLFTLQTSLPNCHQDHFLLFLCKFLYLLQWHRWNRYHNKYGFACFIYYQKVSLNSFCLPTLFDVVVQWIDRPTVVTTMLQLLL